MKRTLPLILFFRDKTIDMKGEQSYTIKSFVFIRKGRMLTFKNITPGSAFKLNIGGTLRNYGDIRFMCKGDKESDLVHVSGEKILSSIIKN